MSPPGETSALTRNLPGKRETHRQDEFLSPRVVAREAVKIMAAHGLEIRPAALRRLVTRFIRDGGTTLYELERRVISYPDPTGEAAVRNLLATELT